MIQIISLLSVAQTFIFIFIFTKFKMVTYVTGCQRLTPRRTECKHLFKDAT